MRENPELIDYSDYGNNGYFTSLSNSQLGFTFDGIQNGITTEYPGWIKFPGGRSWLQTYKEDFVFEDYTVIMDFIEYRHTNWQVFARKSYSNGSTSGAFYFQHTHNDTGLNMFEFWSYNSSINTKRPSGEHPKYIWMTPTECSFGNLNSGHTPDSPTPIIFGDVCTMYFSHILVFNRSLTVEEREWIVQNILKINDETV